MPVDYGYNQTEIPWGDAAIKLPEIRSVLSGIANVGASRVRVECRQNLVQVGGTTNWANMDRALNACGEFGLQPLVCISPGQPTGISAIQYGTFCKLFAQRYGPAGTAQVTDIETINENNWSVFFSPTRASAFADYQRAAFSGIKSVHSTSNVIVGGTAAIGTGQVPWAQAVNPLQWWQDLYAAGIKGFFDAVGFHWYTDNDQFIWTPPSATEMEWVRLLGIRDLMVDQADGDKQIWITEMGYPYPLIPSLVTVRDYLKGQIEMILEKDWLGPPFIYAWRNSGVDTSNQIHQFGMVDYAFQKKQPLYDYVATIAGMAGGGIPIVRPDPPTGVAVTAHTTSSITLTWDTGGSTFLTPAGSVTAALVGGRSTVTVSGNIALTPAGSIAVAVAGGTSTVTTGGNVLLIPAGSVVVALAGGISIVVTGSNTTLTPADSVTVAVAGGTSTIAVSNNIILTPAAPVAVAAAGGTSTVSISNNVTLTPAGSIMVALAGGTSNVWYYRAHNDANLVADINVNSLTGTGLNDGDLVSTITPTAGSELGALTQTSTNRPTFKTNRINGLPSILFDGANDSIRNTAWSRSFGPGYATDPTPVTVFLVGLSTGADDTFYTGGASGVYLTAQRSTSSNLRMSAGDTTNFCTMTSVDANWHVHCHIFDSASSKAMLDVSTGSTATGTTGSSSNARLSGLRLGTNSGALGNFLDGEIARIIIVKGRVSDANIAQEMKQLGTDYALTVT